MIVAEPVWTDDDAEYFWNKWPGDTSLAEVNKRFNVKAPLERIVETNILMTALNQGKLDIKNLERVVDLACGHRVLTKNTKKCRCGVCQEMLDRGCDYDLFRNHEEE